MARQNQRLYPGESRTCGWCGTVHTGPEDPQAKPVTVRVDANGVPFCRGTDCLETYQDTENVKDAMLGEYEAAMGQELYG